jgi:hypothetical protein
MSSFILLCVPSMGENQKGFKSPVYRMNIQKMKRTTRSQLRKGDRPWGGRLWESHQPTNRLPSAERIGMRSQEAEPGGINLIRGRRDGTSWHNAAKFPHSVSEVNEAVGWRRFSFLPGEISTARDRESGSAVRRNALGDGREVSRGHSTTFVNRGDERCPINYETRKREHGKGRTDTMGRPGLPPVRQPRSGVILHAEIGAGQRKRARAKASLFRKERRRTFVTSE